MDELEIIKLEENNETYAIIDEIVDDDITYVYLTNIKDKNDIRIRRVIKENGKEYLEELDNNTEFDKALLLFTAKHKNNK